MSDSVRHGPAGEETGGPDTPGPGGVSPGLGTLLRNGQWTQAIELARRERLDVDVQDALEVLPAFQDHVRARRYPGARLALGAYRTALGRAPVTSPERAAVEYAVSPDDLEAALAALDGLQQESDERALAAGLAPALAHPLTRAEALNMQGVLAAMLGNAAGSRALLEEALQADPKHYRALTNLGNLDLEAGNAAQAEQHYRQVIALNPDYDGGHHNLGVALRRQGRIGESVAAIRRGQRLSVKRSQVDSKADAQDQLARNPALRTLRWVLLAALGFGMVALLRAGGG
ncbi:tetratricopeptide repeat protein [Deinococcus navajonensis]|uniref:Tetratricopeptide repeat protein n=1 Tax=Deinococcus navajonensis TaxID=309884 RepID=A0ABV8XIH9_9DEIO